MLTFIAGQIHGGDPGSYAYGIITRDSGPWGVKLLRQGSSCTPPLPRPPTSFPCIVSALHKLGTKENSYVFFCMAMARAPTGREMSDVALLEAVSCLIFF